MVDGGVAYLEDPQSNVLAIDLATGQILWETRNEEPASGPAGVTVARGMVFAASNTNAFALSVKTGRKIWSVELAPRLSEEIAMAPGYHDGLVFFSTVPSTAPGGVGVLWALNAKSGKKVWSFDTVPKGLWGHPGINWGGGLYYAPAFDGEGGVYVGISNAGPVPGTARYPWGSSRPGPNLYSDSIVKLDEKTGKIEWHYQITPHAICNGSLVSPVLTESRGRKVVIGTGSMGIVVALDRENGKLLWRRPVGVHNGHDNDGLIVMKGESRRLKTPVTIYPGRYGGVPAPVSVKGATVFVPVVDAATRLVTQSGVEQVGPERGELVALDVTTGTAKWKRRFPAPVFGPVVTTNDLVFADSSDGSIHAFDIDNGKQVWRGSLGAEVEGGMTVAGDTLLARTGIPSSGQTPALLAYRLGG